MKKTRTSSYQKRNTKPDNSDVVFDFTKPMRLNRFIALCGVSSRRKADQMIREGSVRVNGRAISELGTMVHPNKDQVFVRNQPVRAVEHRLYVMLNKPPQVMTTMSDPEGRQTVADFVAGARARLFPVGRLDWDSEGLLILTNDGELAQKITHPKHDIPKTYLVKLNGQPREEELQRLTRGISIIGGKARALHIHKMPARGSDKYDWYKIIIAEGRNQQVRRMFEKIHMDVKKLQRVAIGALQLGALEKGKMRVLTPEDIQKIFLLPKELRSEDGSAIRERPMADSAARRLKNRAPRRYGKKPPRSSTRED
jgi:23S rRNA pseudouridine2605 synthase